MRGGFSEEDRNKLNNVFTTVNKVSDDFGSMKNLLVKAVDVIDTQAQQICFLQKELNRANYRNDALNQYGRKESARANGLDPKLHGTDPVKIMLEIVKEIEKKAKDSDGNAVKIDMTENDIQRCHFLGDKKKKLICKFIPYRIRMKILLNKRVINGAKTGKYKDVFISEDLTPMRSRLLWYMKKKCSTKFTKVHSRDGVIKAKKEGADSAEDPWLSIKTPDDLFPHLDEGDDFNFRDFNENLYGMQILPDLPDYVPLRNHIDFSTTD